MGSMSVTSCRCMKWADYQVSMPGVYSQRHGVNCLCNCCSGWIHSKFVLVSEHNGVATKQELGIIIIIFI